MIHFAWPWMFLALPLPWLVRRWLPPSPPVAERALRVPFFDDVSAPPRQPGTRWRTRVRVVLGSLAWLFLVLAAARPQSLGAPVRPPHNAPDLMLAVDLSGSMARTDFTVHGKTVSRLAAVKSTAQHLIAHRRGDRIGLILFGSEAYVQTPLTFDHRVVSTLLDQAEVGFAGSTTAIGDAIGLAIKELRKVTSGRHVLVLFTDGANNAGELAPLQAAQLAAHAGVRIYTVGVSGGGAGDLDEGTLRAVADITGGAYFRAAGGAGVEAVYRRLDEMQPRLTNSLPRRLVRALFIWPLGCALLLAAAVVVNRMGLLSRRPRVARLVRFDLPAVEERA